MYVYLTLTYSYTMTNNIPKIVDRGFIPSKMPNIDAGFVPGRSPAVRLGGMEANNIPYKPVKSTIKTEFASNKDMNPVWAKLLFKGVQKRDKLKKGIHALKDDPSLAIKGLLGKSILDKHINPFFDRIMPDSTKLDVLKKQIKFKPSDRFDMTLGKKSGGANLGFNWRF